MSQILCSSYSPCVALTQPYSKWYWVIVPPPSNGCSRVLCTTGIKRFTYCQHVKGSMVQARSWRHWDTWDGSGKEFWVGQSTAPEMPERIFRAAHDTCKPVLTQTPSLSLFPCLLLTSLFISLFCPFLVNLTSRIQSKTTNSGRTTTGGRRRRRRRRIRSEDWEGAGAWCWGWYEASVLCACRVCVCARLSVHTYAVCSVPAVCLHRQWGRCC